MTKPVCSDCDKPAVGVVPGLVAHFYVCKDHAEKAEKNGWNVDYSSWRLGETVIPKK
jgi:hypothetical protein